MRTGQTRKRDRNEPAIVEALEKHGAVVFRLSGPGVPDLLVCYHQRWCPIEVKASRGQLTRQQQERFLAVAPIPIVRSADEALRLLYDRKIFC